MDQTAHITWIMTDRRLNTPTSQRATAPWLNADIANADITNARYGTLATSGAADDECLRTVSDVRLRARTNEAVDLFHLFALIVHDVAVSCLVSKQTM